jgi:phenylalanyl-tRNA synthetase alpha chain
MLKSGEWKNKDFKAVNLNAKGKEIPSGVLHPLMKMRTAYRNILLEMGFEEMPTNNFVESSFWNFDALFQPQQHPARDAHDTFFLSSTYPKCLFSDYADMFLKPLVNVWTSLQTTLKELNQCMKKEEMALLDGDMIGSYPRRRRIS